MRRGTLQTQRLTRTAMDTAEAKQQLKDLMLEIIGQDEPKPKPDSMPGSGIPDLTREPVGQDVPARNKLRAELRQKVEAL